MKKRATLIDLWGAVKNGLLMERPVPMSMKALLVFSIYPALIIVSPIISAKNVSLGIFGWQMFGGVILTTFAAGLLDVINNKYGSTHARLMVLNAALARAVVWAFILFISILPTAYIKVGYHEIVVGRGFRGFVGGEVGLIISQMIVDVSLFNWLRRFRIGETFVGRYIVSTVLSQFIERVVYITVQTWDTPEPFWKLFWGMTFVRIFIVFLFAPIFWLLTKWIAEKERA